MTVCRNLGITITIDYDDVLFPDIFLKRGDERSGITNNFFELLCKQEETSAAMLWADNFTCSTPAIASWLKPSGKSVEVLPNKLPTCYFNNDSSLKNTGKLKILYPLDVPLYSRDFSVISGVLARLFQEHAGNFELTLLGNSPQLKSFHKLSPQSIRKVDFVPFEDMFAFYASHDVVLMPFEKTILNNAKSPIKYIEAASQATPVIATPVAEFAAKIENGVNGFLCDNDEEWYRLLKKLIVDKSILHNAGQAAYHHVRKEYCINV